jgi:hypothetical protein
MEFIVKTLLFLHVSFGFTSLVLFWLPVFLKKGGKGHIITGKLYVIAMWVVVTNAALLSIKNVIIGKYFMAAFLGFIALITANPLWYGMAILKPKAQSQKRFQMTHIIMDGLMSLIGLLFVVWGVYLNGEGNAVLLLIFGGLGCTVIPSFIKKVRSPYQAEDRIKGHMVGLLTSGIAAYSAFFVFGGYTWMQQILPGMWQVLPWVAPGVVGGVGITLGVKYFRKKGMIAAKA